MLSEYYDEFGEDIPHLFKKQVIGYELYIQEKKIPTIDVFEKVTEYIDSLPYSVTTKRNYKTAMRRYITEISRNYWWLHGTILQTIIWQINSKR